MEVAFNICVKLLKLIGSTFGYTYEEISELICLDLVPDICVLSTLFVLWAAFKNAKTKKRIIDYIILLFSGYYTIAYICVSFMTSIYNSMAEDFGGTAFYLCKDDLMKVAADCHTTYETVNIVIYVYFFAFILLLNFGLFKLLKLLRKVEINFKIDLACGILFILFVIFKVVIPILFSDE